GEGSAGLVLAVGEDHAGAGGGHGPGRLDQFRPARVGGEAAEGVDLGPDGDRVAHDLDALGAVDDAAAGGAFGLEADEDDVGVRTVEAVAEVVHDPAAGAHAGGGVYGDAVEARVQLAGFVRRAGQVEPV